jgi:hypothetical protein
MTEPEIDALDAIAEFYIGAMEGTDSISWANVQSFTEGFSEPRPSSEDGCNNQNLGDYICKNARFILHDSDAQVREAYSSELIEQLAAARKKLSESLTALHAASWQVSKQVDAIHQVARKLQSESLQRAALNVNGGDNDTGGKGNAKRAQPAQRPLIPFRPERLPESLPPSQKRLRSQA